jgi:hypothetical protein
MENKTQANNSEYREYAKNLCSQLKEAEWKMHKAGEQVVVLDRKLQETNERIIKATLEMHRTRMYTLRLRQVTLEGVRNAYFLYARCKMDEMLELQKKVEQLEPWSESESDGSDE